MMLSKLSERFLLVALWALFFVTWVAFIVQLVRWFKSRTVSTHCWFCNSANVVHVAARNSFFCSSCQQYNGFTESGDYNREIAAQTLQSCNPCAFTVQSKDAFTSRSDVLCELCTRNQAKKIEELAKFEASNEENWDLEVENFRKNLDSVYDLCSPCKAKIRTKLHQVDSSVLPSFVTWWRKRCQTKSSPKFSKTLQKNENCGSSVCTFTFRKLLRLASIGCWLFLLFGPFFNLAFNYMCVPETSSKILPFASNILSAFYKIIRQSGFDANFCSRLAPFQIISNIRGGVIVALLLITLFSHALLLLGQWRTRAQNNNERPCNPFWMLFDSCLLISSVDLLLLSSSSIGELLNLGGVKLIPSELLFTVLTVFLTLFAIFGGIFVLLRHWLPYFTKDLADQHEMVKTAWPISNKSTFSSQYGSYGSSFSKFSSSSALNSSFIENDNLSVYSLPMNRLALDSQNLSGYMPRVSKASFLRPSILSPGGSADRCFSAIASPSKWSPPYSGSSEPKYPASTDFYSHRNAPGTVCNDGDSHITSISQKCSKLHSSTDVDGGLKRHRKRRRNTGLLRCCIYFLFGRLDSWKDVKAELFCIANAVLVGILLLLISYLFYFIFLSLMA